MKSNHGLPCEIQPHGSNIAGVVDQQRLDRFNTCVSTFYKLCLALIEFRVQRVDYSTPGFPEVALKDSQMVVMMAPLDR